MSDEISVNVKAAIGVRNVAMPYVSQFAKIETVKDTVTAYGVKFNFPVSGEVSEAHRRELTAALSSILRDAYDSMVRDATNHNVKVDDLARILERLDLSSHHKKFKEEGIDLAAARKLTNDQFEELGITDYSQRSSLMAALEAAGNAGPTVVIENGLLSAWLPFVTIPEFERVLPVFDELLNFSKFELSISPESQGGVEAHLNLRTSRNGVNEISVNPKFTTGDHPLFAPPDSQLWRAIGLLSNLNISLSMYDALTLIKQLEESRMVDEKERIQELPQAVPKIQAAILDQLNFVKKTWRNGEPRWFALLKLLHRDVYGHNARVEADICLGKHTIIRGSIADFDVVMQFYPPGARDITAPAPAAADQQQQQQQQQAPHQKGGKRR